MGQNLGQGLTHILTQTGKSASGQKRTPGRLCPGDFVRFNSEVAFHLFFALPITARTIPAPYYSPTASTFPIVFAASICAGVVTWV